MGLVRWSGAVALACVGAAISVYAAVHHYSVAEFGETRMACNISETFSCDAIARSPLAEVYGIPLAVWGCGFFVGLLLVLLTPSVGRTSRAAFLRLASLVGVVVSIALAVASDYWIKALCPTCIAVYGVTVLLALIMWSDVLFARLTWGVLGWCSLFSVGIALVAGLNHIVVARDMHRTVIEMANQVDIPIDFQRDLFMGHKESPLKVVVFVDYLCPFCAMVTPRLVDLAEDQPDDIVVVLKHFPLDADCNHHVSSSTHKGACEAAKLVQCAGQQVPVIALHQKIYKRRYSTSVGALTRVAENLGLDKDRLEACLTTGSSVWTKVRKDVILADRLGIKGTPAVFINGVRYRGDILDLADVLRERIGPSTGGDKPLQEDLMGKPGEHAPARGGNAHRG